MDKICQHKIYISGQFEAFVLFGQMAVWFSYMSACAAIFGG